MSNQKLAELQERFGYEFKNRSLLETALTHTSYAHEHHCTDNERMEFLGDSILNFIVAKKLYFSDMCVGEMSVERARRVSREPLALATERLGLMKYLRLGVGAERVSHLSIKFKSDLFESLLGAIYLDCKSLSMCEEFIDKHLGGALKSIDYKSTLQEYVQARKLGAISYSCDAVTAATTPEFVARVCVGDKELGLGYGFRKKDAEKDAARVALEFLSDKFLK